jgi:hypothetical protein
MHHDIVMIYQDFWDKFNGVFVLFLGLSNALCYGYRICVVCLILMQWLVAPTLWFWGHLFRKARMVMGRQMVLRHNFYELNI